MELRTLTPRDEDLLANVAPDLFDDEIHLERAREFLTDDRHHLIVAVDGGVMVGFVSAVHYLHPDKPKPEMWVNEVGVAPSHHRRGIARAMMNETLRIGRELGCSEAWVLTERDNEPAMNLYAKSGGEEESPDAVMFTFRFE